MLRLASCWSASPELAASLRDAPSTNGRPLSALVLNEHQWRQAQGLGRMPKLNPLPVVMSGPSMRGSAGARAPVSRHLAGAPTCDFRYLRGSRPPEGPRLETPCPPRRLTRRGVARGPERGRPPRLRRCATPRSGPAQRRTSEIRSPAPQAWTKAARLSTPPRLCPATQ